MLEVLASTAAPLSEHEILVFMVQLLLLVGSARILGGLMKMAGQPAVVGELLSGVLLGPSVFARLAPEAYEWVFGEEVVSSVVFGIAWLGVVFLLVVIGYETDLGIIRRFRRAAVSVSAGGLLLPLAVAGAAAFLVPGSFVGDADRPVFAGFFALAFAVSALPVVGKILSDLGLLRRNFGQITLAAGMTMDAVGWLLLAAFSGIAQDGFDPVALATSFGGLLLFVVFVVTAGRALLDGVMRWVLARGSSLTAGLTVTILAALIGGTITQWLRLEAILGAFIVGILLSTLRHQVPQVERHIETVTASFFAPVFFAFSGLRVDIGLLDSTEVAAWTAGLVVAAVLAKVFGTLIGARLAGLETREGLALGSGLSALGAMGIVVAIVGLNLGVVSPTGYTVMVLAAIVTSLLAPQLLKWVVGGWEVPAEERERLEREALMESSEILGEPSHPPAHPGRPEQPVRGPGDRPGCSTIRRSRVMVVDVVERRWGRRRASQSSDPSDVVEVLDGTKHRVLRRMARDPARGDRGPKPASDTTLVLMGASEEDRDSGVFSSTVDRILAGIDIPAVVVRFPQGADGDPPPPRRILVPVAALPGFEGCRGTRLFDGATLRWQGFRVARGGPPPKVMV
ncbi:MAG: Na+/H+ antiporter [Acidimicrobiia bacterium]|nr:MAG: Na+/H+ antiporter [Acidimicrobiia bacterium]